MSKRTNWTDFDLKTRKEIMKRDNNTCIICEKYSKSLECMHVFLSRAKGGKGCKENGCAGCSKCHNIMDNPIGQAMNELSKKYLDKCKKYLIEEENIAFDDNFIESLKFKKRDFIKENKSILISNDKKCSECKLLVKNKYNNSTIPSYYCKFKKQIVSKKAPICSTFIDKTLKTIQSM